MYRKCKICDRISSCPRNDDSFLWLINNIIIKHKRYKNNGSMLKETNKQPRTGMQRKQLFGIRNRERKKKIVGCRFFLYIYIVMSTSYRWSEFNIDSQVMWKRTRRRVRNLKKQNYLTLISRTDFLRYIPRFSDLQ